MDWGNRLPQIAQKQRDGRSGVPCQFHAQGRCRNGNSCLFSHGEGGQRAIVPAQSLVAATAELTIHPADATPQVDSRSRIPCRFYLRGACSKGDECPFAHNVPKDISQTTAEAQVLGRQDSCGTTTANLRVG
jgi:hypothetical protein